MKEEKTSVMEEHRGGGGATPSKPSTKGSIGKKKKPVKVVYISNPMRVETSAGEFRALVQELTGREAADVPNPARFLGKEGAGRVTVGGDAPDSSPAAVDPTAEICDDVSFEPLDEGEAFTPLIMENFGGSVQARLVYESAQVDGFRSL